jgi:Ribosomal protein L7/L12
MRFNIVHERSDTVVGEADQVEVAQSVLSGIYGEMFVVIDKWSGVALDRPAQNAVPGASILTEEQLPWGTIDLLSREGKKVLAIKLVRELTHLGLGEAKDVVDRRVVEANRLAQEQARLDEERRNW